MGACSECSGGNTVRMGPAGFEALSKSIVVTLAFYGALEEGTCNPDGAWDCRMGRPGVDCSLDPQSRFSAGDTSGKPWRFVSSRSSANPWRPGSRMPDSTSAWRCRSWVVGPISSDPGSEV